MLEVLGQPYIRAASAKGLSWRRVVTEHALPNAAIPTTTIIGFMVGTLIAGAVVVESVFAWPGIGRLLVVSVANRDLAVVQTILLFVAATMVTANIIVDFPMAGSTRACARPRDDRDRHLDADPAQPRRALLRSLAAAHFGGARLDRADAGGGVRRRLAGALSLLGP
jgi:hypothetical protein